MVMLALDTATARTDVAIVAGDQTLAHLHSEGATSHGEALGSLVHQALRRSGLTSSAITAVAVGTGPGPFTGLRVGLAFARTFAWTREIPVHGICSLDVIASAVPLQEEEFLVLTDARRKEVYWARYHRRERVDGPRVGKPAEVAESWGARPVFGEGAVHYRDLFPHARSPLSPSAVDLARLVEQWRSEGRAMPVDAQYLREPDVTL